MYNDWLCFFSYGYRLPYVVGFTELLEEVDQPLNVIRVISSLQESLSDDLNIRVWLQQFPTRFAISRWHLHEFLKQPVICRVP